MTRFRLYGMRAKARSRYFNLGDLIKRLEQWKAAGRSGLPVEALVHGVARNDCPQTP